MERVGMQLPQGPGTLCFDKNEFMKDGFDVDTFMSECRKRVQLEDLRDDLELYYRLLKTAMVELINKDYADFVNLSTNLVGMDKALSQLSVPLGQLKEESLKTSVSDVIQAVEGRLAKQDDIRKKKMCVLRMIQVIRSVEKIEKILNSQNSKENASELNSSLLTGQTLERIATEFNQLQFHAVQSKGMPLLDKVRPRIGGITSMLQQSLEGLLLEGLQTSNVDIIRHCLRTYATIDKTRDAEALIGQVLVKPYVDEVIVEKYVQSHPNGLQVMYNKLLEFVPHHCRLLKEVTGGSISSDKADMVPGYDFLLNCVWPEISRGLEEKLPSLFNPGNPDIFHQKYTISMDFVRKFERQCGSQASVKRLRAHPSYHSFNNKWNLPVYFQIRFKEIAGSLESALSAGLEDAPAGSKYCLRASHVLSKCLTECWSDHIFIPLLAHRFWKLTLQMFSRYSLFINELASRVTSERVINENKNPLLPSNRDSAPSPATSEDQTSGTSPEAQSSVITTRRLMLIVADVEKLKDELPELTEVIKQKLDQIGFKDFSIVKGALEDTCNALSTPLLAVNNKITLDLSESCIVYLKGALEIPRLYRRTNKEVPTKASPYIDNAVKPLHQLQNEYKTLLSQSVREKWLKGALSECAQRYFDTVSDVLSSVKKMEESLKRLKQARRNTTASNASNGGVGDDNKIRLQLALDVEYMGNQIQNLGLQTEDIKCFPGLLELVQAAKEQAIAEQG
ncbi:conserved oligomeric Golgi complex subunit 2 isoform X1 [Pelobates cultripes]|uniref:Conserved oligomeric Golgi complex subunit 2 n=1 Tax=Pelobates cultripes TaxID=61616 RepID=A0AAD1VUY5_PELCU|nr:conserved oligomeric Golgi complex subunit 2 isoform X1 [Pelobates cultripes]